MTRRNPRGRWIMATIQWKIITVFSAGVATLYKKLKTLRAMKALTDSTRPDISNLVTLAYVRGRNEGNETPQGPSETAGPQVLSRRPTWPM
jgi:hypothetical protein